MQVHSHYSNGGDGNDLYPAKCHDVMYFCDGDSRLGKNLSTSFQESDLQPSDK